MNAQWTGKSQAGHTADWAGNGVGQLLETQERRNGFDEPAVHIKFANGRTAWVPISEAEQL